MNSYNKLLNNVVVFAIGTLGSKLIYFLLVPLYTYYLSQAEYGTVDLVTATVTMLIPIVSACMYEAVLRFVIDKRNKESALTNSLMISIIGYVIFLLLYPVFYRYNFLGDSLIYLYILLLVQMLNRIFAQYSRGIGDTKVFAVSGIITAFFTGVLNILFLVVFQWGVTGYFMAISLAYLFSTIYLIIASKPLKSVNLSKLDFSMMSELLHYAVPLIPNYVMWWLINSSSRYFINWFIGIEANGLFGIASKIPALISLVSQVFSQAWQLSAFEKYGEKSSSIFYSKVFNIYMGILFIAASLVTIILKPMFLTLFSNDFYIAWQSVPFLLLGSVFSALSGFVGVTYTASKQTAGVFKTSIYGGIASLVLNVLLIPTLGLVGAGISSMISFFLMFFLRFLDTRKMLYLKIDWIKLSVTTLLILIQTGVLFMELLPGYEMFVNIIILILVVLVNRQIFRLVPFLNNFIGSLFKNK